MQSWNRTILVRAKFKYHNVGQGLFYSGEFKFKRLNNVLFRFVYDCGSEKMRMINSAIRKFKQDVKDSKIDLLIISHLHLDHINGLDELFNNFTIKEIIMPYFTPIERLIIALRRINMPSWYYGFISDPVTYLLEKGVERIIILGGESGEEEDPPEEYPPLSPEGDVLYKLDIEKLPDDEDLKKEILRHDRNWKRHIDTKRLLIKNHHGNILALGLWIFRFFNYKISLSMLHNFERCIRNKGLNINNANDVKRIIIDSREYLRNLKSCYNAISKSLHNDFNNTSLVLYHGPVCRPSVNMHILLPSICYFCNLKTWSYRIIFKDTHNQFGQFLTGDINLNMKYSELRTHYNKYLNTIVISQVPHHGAEKNWNRNILHDLPNNKLWVIPAGLINKYGHPHFRVIEDMLLNRKKYCCVNEVNYIVIKGKIQWQI